MIHDREILSFFPFGAIGGGAKGFLRGTARVGNLVAKPRVLGSIDWDAATCRDFERITGVPATCMDLFDRQQFIDWHGHEPPLGWREATPVDIRIAAGNERPHIVFTSPPCKGFSGLLNETRSKTNKYQALNRLTLRGIWLTLEAWADDPPEFFLLENVPRIATRGAHLVDQISALLSRYGYAVNPTTHDCGELGELAQSRKRFLLVARHMEKVAPFLYEPRRRPLQAVGTVLDRMLLPGDPAGGAMHRIPNLQWKTWVRLAFVEAGKDWRSLNRLAVEDGMLRDYAILPDSQYHNGYLGVHGWEETSGTVAGESRPSNGAFSVADPRFDSGGNDFGQYGVKPWGGPTGAVINVKSPGQGPNSIADPRVGGIRHANVYNVTRWGQTGRCVTSGRQPSNGGGAVADPRPPHHDTYKSVKYKVTKYETSSGTVISGSTTGMGAFSVADPRPGFARGKGDAYLTGGHYGVVDYAQTGYAVTSAACHDNGFNSVADPRLPELSDKLTCIIRAEDGTWHRPFTTLELAALQSLVDPEEKFELDGLSDSAWRERIGNAVPPAAAEAIASVMYRTLLAAWEGQTFFLDAQPIWVQPIATAIALPGVPAE